ncbi:MAG: nucleotidyltransferase family protein [Leptospiraceae bacterium]|nr:nucleotidyltransferase family protein [Leptospiraceae bacterium]MDW7974922.1 nucleotidyltransferase family protein [Leptospiraceae bacterium]
MTDQALILAGGFGTRLRSVVKDLPKPMAPIQGKPFLEYLLTYLETNGIRKVILSVGYLKEKIMEHFGSRFLGMEIVYSPEDQPLGTGGALKQALNLLEQEFFLLNGDTFFAVNLKDMFEFHKKKQSHFTIALKQIDDCKRYGSVLLDDDGRIVQFIEKREGIECLINGGVYLLSRALVESISLKAPFSLERDFLEKTYKEKKFYGFVSDGYFIDIGIPEDYQRADRELASLFETKPK